MRNERPIWAASLARPAWLFGIAIRYAARGLVAGRLPAPPHSVANEPGSSGTALGRMTAGLQVSWGIGAVKHAELVAFRISKNLEALVAALADVGPNGTKTEQPFDLGRSVGGT